MDNRQRLFIYDRKEMGVLVLLAVMVAVFAFTLGVHLGKRVIPHPPTVANSETTGTVTTSADEVPNRQELQDQSKGTNQAGDESLSQTLHDEVGRTGIKLDSPRQTDLPNKPARANGKSGKPAAGGETDTAENSEAPAPARTVRPSRFFGTLDEIAASKRATPEGRFTLQVGSFPRLEDAKDKVDSMEALGLQPALRAVELRGKGKWYRIFLGGFSSKDDAERAGQRYKSEHVIDSFIVSRNAG